MGANPLARENSACIENSKETLCNSCKRAGIPLGYNQIFTERFYMFSMARILIYQNTM